MVTNQTAPVEEPPLGIGDLIPGFKDGLLAITSSDNSTMDLTVWPVAGTSFDRDVPLGVSTSDQEVRFDASGRRIATMSYVPGEAFSGLSAGAPDSISLIDIGVTGYAWHDSAPGEMAFTTQERGGQQLWTMDAGSTAPELLTSLDLVTGGVVAWGEWGFAVEHLAAGTVSILKPSGVTAEIHEGRLIGSSPSGRLVIDNDDVSVIGDGLDLNFEGRFDGVGNSLVAEISPDGRRLAVLGDSGILVLPLEGDSSVIRTEPRFGVAQIAWTSDSRFILIPSARGIAVFDTQTSRLDYVLGDRTVLGVSVLPLNN